MNIRPQVVQRIAAITRVSSARARHPCRLTRAALPVATARVPRVSGPADGAWSAGRPRRRAAGRGRCAPSRPLVSSAAQSALRTASSVASTVAAKSGSSSASGSRARAGRRRMRAGGEREEDLAAAVVGDRAGAREPEAGAARDALELGRARAARRWRRPRCSCRRARGAPPGSGTSPPGAERRPPARRRCAGPAPRRSSRARARRPSRRAPRRRGSSCRSRPSSRSRSSRCPAPTAPWATGPPAAAASARPGVVRLDLHRAASLSQLSSHSATTGMTTSVAPTAGSAAAAAATAPS